MTNRIGEKGMIQERPGVVRKSLICCQEQTIFAKTIFL